MATVSAAEIIAIHNIVVKRFKISRGVINTGVLDAVTKRPDTGFGDERIFDNVYKKAAGLLESIIRWHPFADGNKRTALLTMIYYLKKEGYGIALPLSAVRLTVTIAKNTKNDPESATKLIEEITKWIVLHADKDPNKLKSKVGLYIAIPYLFLVIIQKIGFKKYVYRKISNWMSCDIYPEYEKDANEIIAFMQDAIIESVKPLIRIKLKKNS